MYHIFGSNIYLKIYVTPETLPPILINSTNAIIIPEEGNKIELLILSVYDYLYEIDYDILMISYWRYQTW